MPKVIMDRLKAHKAKQAEYALRLGKDYNRELALVFPRWAGEPWTPGRLTDRIEAVDTAGEDQGQTACPWLAAYTCNGLA